MERPYDSHITKAQRLHRFPLVSMAVEERRHFSNHVPVIFRMEIQDILFFTNAKESFGANYLAVTFFRIRKQLNHAHPTDPVRLGSAQGRRSRTYQNQLKCPQERLPLIP
jgi:hypothetical protein